MENHTGMVPMSGTHLIYSVVKQDQTGQYYTRDPLEALGAVQMVGGPMVTCHPARNINGDTFLVLPGKKHIKVEVKKTW